MKIAVAQINTIIGDFENNFRKIKNFVTKAKDLNCDLIVFSEMVLSGYPPKDLLEKQDFIKANLACLANIGNLTRDIKNIGVVCGFIDENLNNTGKNLYNSLALIENGEILYKANKRLLPTYDVFDEERYFEHGDKTDIYLYKGKNIGFTICEDIWNDKDIFKKRIYQIDPVAKMAKNGVNLIINISASPFNTGKQAFKFNMLSSIAKKYGVFLVYANQVGGNDSLIFDGASVIFNQKGRIIAKALDFEEDIACADLDNLDNLANNIACLDKDLEDLEIENVLKALIIGTRDYVKKCGFSKAVIGLSGGIDSALTAYIARESLGSENVLGVFMPSRYTSQENFEDTKLLANNLQIELKEIPIDSMFCEFVKFLSPNFNSQNPDVAEQNIQARIRGTILMGLSNKHNSIVLTTGNKSELAVGYCTLYGDMNGGLAVISDVSKTMVYKLSEFINKEQEFIPKRIIKKAPSAELKPNQKDQDDLPDYDTLDKILKAYIEDLKSTKEIINLGYDAKTVENIVKRINQNEYKRHQAAPGLKVTPKAFGYGRRYPLAQKYFF